MSLPEESQQQVRLRLGMLNWFLLALGCGLLVSQPLFAAAGTRLEAALRFGFLGLILLLWWRSSGAVILLAAQACLFFTEWPRLDNDMITLLWLPALVLAIVVSAERFRQQRAFLRLFETQDTAPRRRIGMWRLSKRLSQALDGNRDRLSRLRVQVRTIDFKREYTLLASQIAWLAVGLALSLAAAWFVLWLVPLDPESRQKIRLLPTGYRAITLTILLGLAYIAVATLVNAWRWRRLSTRQARSYLRGSLASWLEADWRRVVNRNVKRRKQLKN